MPKTKPRWYRKYKEIKRIRDNIWTQTTCTKHLDYELHPVYLSKEWYKCLDCVLFSKDKNEKD